jgi:cytosine/adenosine deaminase-related metal-dependent hydrolase
MIGSFTFESLPCRVVFGSGTLSAVADELQRLGTKRALVLTTPQQEALGRKLESSLGPLFVELGSGAAETEIIDGTGRIVIPGLINAHMHTWQTALRGFAAVGLAVFDSAISLNVDHKRREESE